MESNSVCEDVMCKNCDYNQEEDSENWANAKKNTKYQSIDLGDRTWSLTYLRVIKNLKSKYE